MMFLIAFKFQRDFHLCDWNIMETTAVPLESHARHFLDVPGTNEFSLEISRVVALAEFWVE